MGTLTLDLPRALREGTVLPIAPGEPELDTPALLVDLDIVDANIARMQAFADNEAKVNKETVYDFSSTNDIIGGNSGSPVINAEGEVIGAAFDGNIHSLGGAFGYDPELNRTVSVSTAAITEALRNVYPNPRILEELGVR